MKKIACLLVFLIFYNPLFSRGTSTDSVKNNPQVLCSFFLSSVTGIYYFGNSYNTKIENDKICIPFDARFYFFKNHIGIGVSTINSVSTAPTTRLYHMTFPVMKVVRNQDYKINRIVFVSYNFDLKKFETKKVSPFIQLNFGRSNWAKNLFFVTIGAQYKLTKNIAINLASNIRYGFGVRDEYFPNNYIGADLNLGLCFRIVNQHTSGNKQEVSSSKLLDSSAIAKQKFLVEIGAGFYAGRVQPHRNEYEKMYVDTVNYFENDFITVKRSFPSLAFGYIRNNQSFQLEGSMVKHKAIVNPYYIGVMTEESKEYYIAIGYYHNNIAALWKASKKRAITIFAGAKLLFGAKSRDITDYWANEGFIANHFYTDQTHSFNSKNIRLLLEPGLRWQCNRHFFAKLGCGINTIGYIHGRYTYSYHSEGTMFNYFNVSRSKDEKYDEFLYAGKGRYFSILDNIFLKLGYSF